MTNDRTPSRIIAIVTALLLVVPAGRSSAASIDQLVTINRMVSQRDWAALRDYIAANPSLVEGSDPLAVELGRFVASMNRETLDTYAQTPFVTGRLPKGTY